MKKVLTLILSCMLFLSINFTSFAANVGYENVTQQTLDEANKLHNYYGKKIAKEDVILAETYAKQIADAIMADPTYTTDLQRVNAAAAFVSELSAVAAYSQDSAKYYKSPAGLLTKGIYTCAGTTRTLGRILDYMGFTWAHARENQNAHQWCIVEMDGQIGYADGMGGFAGYGEMYSGMTLPNGQVICFP